MKNEDRKIAIVGTAEPHWRAAPFDREDWEIWTCGGIFNVVPRTDRHFELHDKAETCKGWARSLEEEAAARSVYWQWIADNASKVYVKAPVPEAPSAKLYPIREIVKAFPDKYFTNSISYMVALAIHEGCSEMGLWGIDMALSGSDDDDEYGRQRPSVEFYLGIAMASGITVHLPEETTLLKSRRLYGFDGPQLDGFNRAALAKIHELQNRQVQIRKFIEQTQAQITEAEKDLRGTKWALEVAQYFKRNMEH